VHTDHNNISLPDYVRGTLNSDEMIGIEDHLRTCAACRKDLAEIKETFAAIDREVTKDVAKAYFATLIPKIHERIDQQRNVRWIFNPILGKIVLPLGAAIIVAALVWQIPAYYQSSANRNGLLAAVDASTPEEIAEMLQANIPNHEMSSFNNAIISGVLANDRFVDRELVREALASESTSPFNVVADMSPQQFLDGFGESAVTNVLDKLGTKEDL
jgi:hypothetical protein